MWNVRVWKNILLVTVILMGVIFIGSVILDVPHGVIIFKLGAPIN